MTFATALEQPKTRRFALVRATTARHITSGLTVYSGSVYQYAFGFAVATSGLKRNGVAFTKVASLAAVTLAGTFYVDETAGTVYLYPTGGSVNTTTDHYIFSHYLFWTDYEGGIATYETPTDTSTQRRPWEPRLLESPSADQAVSDVFVGIFTINNSSVSVANADKALYRYLGANDSFSQKPIEIWFCVDSTANIQQVYRGRSNAASISVAGLTLSFYDDFSRLNQPAYMGDSTGQALYLLQSNSFPSLNPASQNTPCPLILGKFSPYKLRNSAWGAILEDIDPESLYKAQCTVFSTSTSTSTNRRWGLCRIPSAGLRTPSLTIGAKSAVSNTTNGIAVSWLTATWNAATRDIVIGDLVKITEGAQTRYGRVASIRSGGATMDMYINIFGTFTSFTTALALTWLPDPAVIITSGSATFYPAPIRDYNYSLTATDGGNYYVDILFANNFEAGVNGWSEDAPGSYSSVTLTQLDPSVHVVSYRVSVATSALNHSDVLKSICQAAGLTCDTTTFAAAKVALAANTCFTIPTVDEQDYNPYLKYAQDILKSTLGYAALDSSVHVVYTLLAAPTLAATTTDDAVFSGMTIDVDYQDIATQVIAYNDHRPIVSDFTASSSTQTSNRALYLHEIDNRDQFVHVLEDITLTLPSIMALRAERKAYFKFFTAARYLDAGIGDSATVSTDELIGSSTTANLKIIGTTKSTSQVAIQATDLKGL